MRLLPCQVIDDRRIGLVAVAGMSHDFRLICRVETVGVLIRAIITILKVRPDQIDGKDLPAEREVSIEAWIMYIMKVAQIAAAVKRTAEACQIVTVCKATGIALDGIRFRLKGGIKVNGGSISGSSV